MELIIIRPLFIQYGIADCLPIVNYYLINSEYDENYQNIREYKYHINCKYVLLELRYFGIYFHSYTQEIMLKAFVDYITKLTSNYTRIYDKRIILKNNHLNQYCHFDLKEKYFNHLFEGNIPYYYIKITFIKHYNHNRSVFGNYINHYVNKYKKSYNECVKSTKIRCKYNINLDAKNLRIIPNNKNDFNLLYNDIKST